MNVAGRDHQLFPSAAGSVGVSHVPGGGGGKGAGGCQDREVTHPVHTFPLLLFTVPNENQADFLHAPNVQLKAECVGGP